MGDMRVYVPAPRQDHNPFLKEIEGCCQARFSFGDLDSYESSYPVVLVQWPEQLFDWKEPTEEDIARLKECLQGWRNTAKIIYLVHNLQRHYGMTKRYENLYALVESHSDAMVHLGEYSCSLFKNRYPDATHIVIPHPLYESSFAVHSKKEARETLGISLDKLVVIAPGRIRNDAERSLVKSSFDSAVKKRGLLLVPSMKRQKVSLGVLDRRPFRKIIDLRAMVENWRNGDYDKRYRFGYSHASREALSLLMSAADIVFIPRITALNSGNLFLGLSYRKIVVGPDVGNLSEFLDAFRFPKFDPTKEDSAKAALGQAIDLFQGGEIFPEEKLAQFSVRSVAEKWDKFIGQLVSG